MACGGKDEACCAPLTCTKTCAARRIPTRSTTGDAAAVDRSSHAALRLRVTRDTSAPGAGFGADPPRCLACGADNGPCCDAGTGAKCATAGTQCVADGPYSAGYCDPCGELGERCCAGQQQCATYDDGLGSLGTNAVQQWHVPGLRRQGPGLLRQRMCRRLDSAIHPFVARRALAPTRSSSSATARKYCAAPGSTCCDGPASKDEAINFADFCGPQSACRDISSLPFASAPYSYPSNKPVRACVENEQDPCVLAWFSDPDTETPPILGLFACSPGEQCVQCPDATYPSCVAGACP